MKITKQNSLSILYEPFSGLKLGKIKGALVWRVNSSKKGKSLKNESTKAIGNVKKEKAQKTALVKRAESD